jgi:hypothetical protein
MKMRVFVEKTLRYYLLGQGQEMLPAGPYSVTPLGAGYMPEPANSVAKRLEGEEGQGVHWLDTPTLEAWRKAGHITVL